MRSYSQKLLTTNTFSKQNEPKALGVLVNAKKILKGISCFYWLHAFVLILLAIVSMWLVSQTELNLMKGMLILLGLGQLFYAVSFGRLGRQLWCVKQDGLTQAIRYSATFVGFVCMFLFFVPNDLEFGYFVFLLFLCAVHVLVIWRLKRKDVDPLFSEDRFDIV